MLQNKIAPFFVCLIVFLAGCAPAPAAQTPPLILPATATIANIVATATSTPTETPTIAPTETPQIPPEILTAVDLKDARNKILPYCKVHPDLSDGSDSVKILSSIPKIPELWKLIEPRLKNHEIYSYGGNVVNLPDGSGGCIVVPLDTETKFIGAYFESKFNGEWIEVKFTGKK